MFRNQIKDRKFKKGITVEDSKRRRDDISVKLRQSQRIEQMQKRRQMSSSTNTAANTLNALGINVPLSINNLMEYVNMARSNNPEQMLQGTSSIRKLLSVDRDPPLQEVIKTGVIPTLIEHLTKFNLPKLQFEACWALTNVASGSSEQTDLLVKLNAVPLILDLLNSNDVQLIEQAVWGLSNIAGDGMSKRDLILQLDGMTKLCGVVQRHQQNLSLVRNVVWAISNLCRGKIKPKFEVVRQCIPIVCGVVMSMDDEEAVTDACWSISYLVDDHTPKNIQIETVLKTGVLPRLVQGLLSSDKVVIPALRAIGNIVTGTDEQTEAVVASNAIPALMKLTTHANKSVRKESAWTLSNIGAGSKAQIQSLLQQGIMKVLANTIEIDHQEVKQEAAWTLSNIINGGGSEEVKFLVDAKGIDLLIKLLDCNTATILIALNSLEAILSVGSKDAIKSDGINKYRNVIEECGGLDVIEHLQEHDDEEVYNKSAHIIETYLIGDDIEEENNPTLMGDSNNMNFGMQNQENWNKPFVFGGNQNAQAQPQFNFGVANNQPQPHFVF